MPSLVVKVETSMQVRKNKFLKIVVLESRETEIYRCLVEKLETYLCGAEQTYFQIIKNGRSRKSKRIEFGRESRKTSMRGRKKNKVLKNAGQESRESRNLPKYDGESRDHQL